jgi:hypothetical protein
MNYSGEQFIYLTTTGRKTGRPREIEIWFVEDLIDEEALPKFGHSGYRADFGIPYGKIIRK